MTIDQEDYEPRRVIMQMIDAGPGSPNWARFKCSKCGHDMETHTATDRDIMRGVACPECNKISS